MKFDTSIAHLRDLMKLDSGFAFKSSDWVDAGIPVIKIRNVQDGYVDLTGCSFVNEKVASKAKDWFGKKGNTLIALTGAGVGEIGRIHASQEGLINQRVGWVRPISLDDEDYIYYLLRYYKQQIIELASGSAQPNVSPRDILSIECKVPLFGHRKTIGSMMANLDKKIETNKQLSKTLEEIAQTIFKSWFIDFDPVKVKMAGEKPVGMDAATAALFPDSMEDSELGLIPKGWSGGNLGHILDIFDSRRVPLSGAERKKRSGLFPYYGAAGVIDFIDDYLFTGPHVLVGEDGTVVTSQGKPVVQYVWGNFWVSNHAHVLKGNAGISVEYLKLLLDRIDISNFITGAVQPKLSQGNLKAVRCVMPSRTVLEGFDVIIQPVFESIRILKENSKTLVEIRDSLLPRLISGELQIPEEMLVS
jgi:type I restriction enzyme S subunit